MRAHLRRVTGVERTLSSSGPLAPSRDCSAEEVQRRRCQLRCQSASRLYRGTSVDGFGVDLDLDALADDEAAGLEGLFQVMSKSSR
jgi:hypothetical protein